MLLACGQSVIIFRAMKTAASGLMTYKRNMEIYLAQSLIAGFILALLAGCSGLPRSPLPVEDIRRAEIPGMSGVRAWGGQLKGAARQTGTTRDDTVDITPEAPARFSILPGCIRSRRRPAQ